MTRLAADLQHAVQALRSQTGGRYGTRSQPDGRVQLVRYARTGDVVPVSAWMAPAELLDTVAQSLEDA